LLREKLLPAMIAHKRRHNNLAVRIWSAGCANGQEIYSVIIMLKELLPDFDRWKLHVIGSDINMDVIAEAIKGNYSKWSFRDMPEQLIEKYFSIDDGCYTLNQDICQRVRFFYHNLSKDAFPALHLGIHAMDLILCRNVFIYLESAVNQKILGQFADCLSPDGLLILGASDYANWQMEKLEYIQTSETAYFRKISTDLTAIEKSSSIYPVNQFATSPESPQKQQKIRQQQVGKHRTADFERIMVMMREAKWLDAIRVINEAIEADDSIRELLLLKVNALANLGQLSEALTLCETYQSLNPTDKHGYLLKGIILIEDIKVDEAESALRKAIYLDYTFPEAHYQLGLLQLNRGRYEAGLKSLSIALSHARKYPDRIVHNSPGMSYERFSAIIAKEMQLYETILRSESEKKNK